MAWERVFEWEEEEAWDGDMIIPVCLLSKRETLE